LSYPPLINDTFIHEEYAWTTGKIVGRFLGELKANRRIMAVKCSKCGKVYVPPVKRCGQCYKDTAEWLEVGPGGTVTSFTIVHKGIEMENLNLSYPHICALIRLDGADTDLIHFIDEIDGAEIETGMRVIPVWSEEPKGCILDIKYFKPEGE